MYRGLAFGSLILLEVALLESDMYNHMYVSVGPHLFGKIGRAHDTRKPYKEARY